MSVEEKDIGVGNQLKKVVSSRSGEAEEVRGAHCLDSLLRPSADVNAEDTLSTPPTLSCESIQSLKVA